MPYLTGEIITMRALEPEDLDILYRWENDSSLWKYGSTLSPYSRFILKDYLENSGNDIYQTRQLRLMIIGKNNRQPVGTIDLFDFDPHHSRAAVGILISPEFQQKGIGSEALHLLTRYASEFLHIHQLYAHIPADNKASIRLFGQAGFRQCGILSEWIKTGNGYGDVIVTQYIPCNNR